LGDYWRAQRQGKAGHDNPLLFLGQIADKPISLTNAGKIYNRAVQKSGVQRKGAFMYCATIPGSGLSRENHPQLLPTLC
jgi:hypothetical protein